MRRWQVLLLLLLSLLLDFVETRALLHSDHLVHTSLGDIRGLEQKVGDAVVSAFLGVPYARSPVGPRRFTRPQKVDKWNGVFEARTPAATCFYTLDGVFPHFPGAEMWNAPNKLSEDCLSMNIWVPQQHDGSVLVWIYGGGFFSGSPSLELYDGATLAAQQGVILVNINYRLGPFGFLYLGPNTDISGNMGLLDQQLALQWVHDQIGAFGGDPQRVTLFGESAGAASVTAHLFAPGSQSLFSRFIAKSGAIINSWATKPKEVMLEMSLQLVRALNCSRPDVRQVERCLEAVPTSVVQTETDKLTDKIRLPMTFAFVPVEEDAFFFQGNLFEKLHARAFKKDVSALLGTVKDEGTYWLPYYMSSPDFGFHFNHTISAEDPHNRAFISRAQYKRALEAFMPYFGSSPLIQHALMHAYEGVSESKEREKYRDGVARFLGDYFFTCGVIDFADILSDNIFGSVYMYYFTMRSSANPWPKWMGAMHGYEIEYVFGQPLSKPALYKPDVLQTEQRFSKLIMQFWKDFAAGGQPVSFWPKYNRVERKALRLDEALVDGHHKVTVDVHGAFCRLLHESALLSSYQDRGCGRDRPLAVVSSMVAALPSWLLLASMWMLALCSLS